MSTKHNPYLRLFTRDIEGSPKINALSLEASGLYFRLLNRFNEPPRPGSLALHEWEPHHNWKRSLTQQCLANPNKRERLQYFAKYLSRIFQWKSADILKALQELYFFGIVVVEDDRLIQPRMYRDNGYKLAHDTHSEEDLDPATGALNQPQESDAEAPQEAYNNNGENLGDKKEKKTTKKNTQKTTQKNAPSHARVHALSSEYENNINGSSKEDSIDSKAENENSNGNETKPTPQKRKKSVADNPPTIEEIQAYFNERAQQGKPFVYVTPESFFDACEQSGWRLKDGKPMISWQARVRTFENYRRERGDAPVSQSAQRVAGHTTSGDPVPATPTRNGKYDKW